MSQRDRPNRRLLIISARTSNSGGAYPNVDSPTPKVQTRSSRRMLLKSWP